MQIGTTALEKIVAKKRDFFVDFKYKTGYCKNVGTFEIIMSFCEPNLPQVIAEREESFVYQ